MNVSWYIQRLRTMSLGEVLYRLSQRLLQRREKIAYSKTAPVYSAYSSLTIPAPNYSVLRLNFSNKKFSCGRSIELLGDYDYDKYRKRWHAAFKGETDWPMRCSYDYLFSDDGVPGDIRINWELNRHRQFALLAKSFYVTKDKQYLNELFDLFEDWNDKNPFLYGPEWASPMEESIRLINWLISAAFLNAASKSSGNVDAVALRDKLSSGAWAMAAHVRKHYSRYSSANNHTIVEAAGVGIAAAVFGETDWLDEASAILEIEIDEQTWSDGVNKEQALHYQLFVMEAICLFHWAAKAIGYSASSALIKRVKSMAKYAYTCVVSEEECIEFGDDDDGVILNLGQGESSYPDYVLTLVSLEFGEGLCWSVCDSANETIAWLFTESEINRLSEAQKEVQKCIEHFPEGGISVFRSKNGHAALAFDHGPLGHGSLAAHGHADALSVQLYVNGRPILVDPGTYVYNGDRKMRNLFRSTAMHNTVTVLGENQSEMLGPFLWGKRAICEVDRVFDHGVSAKCTWKDSCAVHSRIVEMQTRSIVIKDSFACSSNQESAIATYIFAPDINLRVEGNLLRVSGQDCDLVFQFEEFEDIRTVQVPYSSRFGIKTQTSCARVYFGCKKGRPYFELKTTITGA